MEPVSPKNPVKKLVGTVAPAERDVIKRLYERKNGLIELFKSLTDIDKEESSKLYERLVTDMAETSAKYQGWFDAMSLKYKWDNIPGYKWEINFESCEVFLSK